MKSIYTKICLAVLLGAGLGGCASADGQYPSLAVRDAERVQGTFTPPSPSDQPAVIGITNLDELLAPVDRAEKANAQFLALQSEVRALVSGAQGLGVEDDRRAQALAGLAQLTSLRGQTALALSDLDLLEAKAATAFERTKEIRDFQTGIRTMIGEQDAVLDSLGAALAP